jgi:putative transport protein
VIGVVLFVQLLPRFLRIDLVKEEDRLRDAEPKGKRVQRKQFAVSNPACLDKTLAELEFHRISEANVTRVSRNGEVIPAGPDTRLRIGDVVLAVGREEELKKLTVLFGEEIHGEDIFKTTDVVARDATVSNDDLVGKSLTELRVLRNYGVVISRVFREELHFVPTGTYVLETGDLIRVTGTREDVEEFVALVGRREGRIYETNLPALAIGIFLGLLLGWYEFTLPGGASFRLGLAGGPLLVSLVLSHFGRIGDLTIRIHRGAKYLLRQLGLVLFLAGAGVEAGASLDSVLLESGFTLLAAGAMVTLVSVLAGFLANRYLFKHDLLSSLGAVCGGMTSTPALGSLSEMSTRNEPVLAYTGVYPVALVLITIVCKFLYYLV